VAYRGTRVWRALTAAMYSVSAGVRTRANVPSVGMIDPRLGSSHAYQTLRWAELALEVVFQILGTYYLYLNSPLLGEFETFSIVDLQFLRVKYFFSLNTC
jgi:hypothetical protein